MQNKTDRYEMFGWDYEYFNPPNNTEINWYLDFAKRGNEPVIELACGSGRLLIAMARAGVSVWGIDNSLNMLSLAKDRLGKETLVVKNRVKLVAADITEFHLAGQFALAIFADNSFRELGTLERMERALRRVHLHLAEDGMFLVTVRINIKDKLNAGSGRSNWSSQLRNPFKDELVTRRVEWSVSEDNNTIQTILHYRTESSSGAENHYRFVSEAPLMDKKDYIRLFETNGFLVEDVIDVESLRSERSQLIRIICKKRT